MKRLLVLLALLLPTIAAAQHAPWQAIVSRDLRFRVEMPFPVEQVTAPERERGHASPRQAWAAKRDEELFDFDFVDYQDGALSSRDSKIVARELGRGEAEKAFPLQRFKYVRDEPVTSQGWDGYALDIEDEKGHGVMMRTFVVRDRLYRLLVSHKGDFETKSAAQRFLESLKFAETRAP
ncbi:MAG TPA: hypothetical protein VEC14_13760 [Reyranellaceae bacterium]|nr:hypothetical protein [Reyranellaceae bacterium]